MRIAREPKCKSIPGGFRRLNLMRKLGVRGGAELRLALSYDIFSHMSVSHPLKRTQLHPLYYRDVLVDDLRHVTHVRDFMVFVVLV